MLVARALFAQRVSVLAPVAFEPRHAAFARAMAVHLVAIWPDGTAGIALASCQENKTENLNQASGILNFSTGKWFARSTRFAVITQ